MKLLLMASAGGALGAGARYLVSAGMLRLVGPSALIPWSTITVNIVGCFLMGILIEALALRFSGTPEIRTFLATGVLGGFTTFSAFALDFATLMSRKEQALGLFYVLSSVGLSILAFYAGLLIARQVWA